MLGIRTLAIEVHSLAESHLTTAGATRPNQSPRRAGHGISTRPQVVAEALETLTSDDVVKTSSAINSQLQQVLKRFESAEAQFTYNDINTLLATINVLKNKYIDMALNELIAIPQERPKEFYSFESIISCLVSDLRGRDWTDETLLILAETAETKFPPGNPSDFPNLIRWMGEQLNARPDTVRCYIPIDLRTESEKPLHLEKGFRLEHPPTSVQTELQGASHFICVELTCTDPRHAARDAYRKVAAVLGSMSVFTREPVKPIGSRVFVQLGETGTILTAETQQQLVRDPHNASPGSIERVIASVLAATKNGEPEATFDAIHHHHRALDADDVESQFMLLWFGIERLCSGESDASSILDAVRTHVPRALALGKIRRDITALADAIGEYLWPTPDQLSQHCDIAFDIPGGRRTVAHEKLLTSILAPPDLSVKMTSRFYENPGLTQWYSNLQRKLRGDSPATVCRHVADLIAKSKERIEWQILRLYRARNHVVHGGFSQFLLADYSRHAHYYLTNLISIIVHYRGLTPLKPPIAVLAERCGQYDTYLSLLRAPQPVSKITDVQNLLPRPIPRPSASRRVLTESDRAPSSFL